MRANLALTLIVLLSLFIAISSCIPGSSAALSLSSPRVAGVSIDQDLATPEVTWISPVTDGGFFTVWDTLVPLEVNASDDTGVERVHFFWWDRLDKQYVDLGDDLSAPYQEELSPAILNPGYNEIFAQAVDTSGNVSERKHIWLDKSPPTPTPTPTPTATPTPTPTPMPGLYLPYMMNRSAFAPTPSPSSPKFP